MAPAGLWSPLADVRRHLVRLRPGVPVDDLEVEIIAALRLGRVAHRVDKTLTYGLKARSQYVVTEHTPMSPEVFVVGGPGGAGFLRIDWRQSRVTRQAGRRSASLDGRQAGGAWPRIEFEGIRLCPEHVAALWPEPIAAAQGSAPAAATEPTVVEKLSGKAWVHRQFERRKSELVSLSKADASRQLAKESKTAPGARPVTARYIARLISDYWDE